MSEEARQNESPAERASARVVVCEWTGSWATALRREGIAAPVETRTLAEAWKLLGRWPASFLVLELSDRTLEGLLVRLPRMARDYSLARAAVVAGRPWQSYEWLAREAGAVHFLVSPRRLRPLVELIGRHLAQSPAEELTLREQIWARLPWGTTRVDSRSA